MVDLLAGANWQRAKKGTPKPKPVPRPGSKRFHHGKTGLSPKAARALLDSRNPHKKKGR